MKPLKRVELNQFVIVGTIDTLMVSDFDGGESTLVVIVSDETNPELDMVLHIKLENNLARGLQHSARKGKTVGVKGYFSTDEEGHMVLNAEKVTFIETMEGRK